MGGTLPPLLPGYRIKILDGNCLEATEDRIRELRGTAAGPLPGKSLVVLDPSLKLLVEVFGCEDGYTQERALLEHVLPTVEPGDCWIEDRNFCTLNSCLHSPHGTPISLYDNITIRPGNRWESSSKGALSRGQW
jgi:hypothetical protein